MRSDPTFSVKAEFEVFEQAEAVCCVGTVCSEVLDCWPCTVTVQQSLAAKRDMGEVEQPWKTSERP